MRRCYDISTSHIAVRLSAALLVLAAWTAGPAAAQPEELPLGSSMPAVNAPLTSPTGEAVDLASVTGENATVFIFWSHRCPWVDRYEERVLQLAGQMEANGVGFVLVNPNSGDEPVTDATRTSAQQLDGSGPNVRYLLDPDAALARALGASRAPHVFVFDSRSTLVYAGTIDDSPASTDSVEKPYLRDALDAVLAGNEVPVADTKAFGCTLKYE